MQTKTDFWSLGVPGLALFSSGLAVLVAPITATALSSAPTESAGVASGVNSTISRLGNLLAVAVIGLVVSIVFQRSGGSEAAVPLAPGQKDAALHAASTEAFRAGMMVTAALAFGGAVIAARWVSNSDAREAETVPPEAVAHAITGPSSTC